MNIRKIEFKALSARKLRAIALGKFKGIKSTQRDIRESKKELKRRGLI